MTQSMGRLTSIICVLCFFGVFNVASKPSARASELGVDQSKQKKQSKSIDDELTDELERELSDNRESEDDTLDEAVRSMRNVQKRIASSDTGKSTRDMQQKIAQNLETLIKRFTRRNQSLQQINQYEEQRPGTNKNKSDQGNKKPNTGEKLPSGKQSGNKDDANDSTNRTDRAEQRKAKFIELNRRSMIEEIWGHLPDSVRKRILNIDSEQSLPKYAEHVRRYYESLAESVTPQSSK